MISWGDILKKRGKTAEIKETNEITTPEFAKKLRNKLNMSQKLFAQVLGVSVKTVEKWEQGVNPVSGPTSKLMYLLDKNEDLINDLYIVTDHSKDNLSSTEYVITIQQNQSEGNYIFDDNDFDAYYGNNITQKFSQRLSA